MPRGGGGGEGTIGPAGASRVRRSRAPLRCPYGTDPSQWGALTRPEAPGPHPVAVVLHGGFWKAMFGAELMDAVSADLAARGWAAWNLEYRRVGRRAGGGGGWPQTFEDVAAGIDHLAALAGEHALDLDHVVAVGHSAGGQLAAWAAARPGLPAAAPGAGPRVRIRAVVAQAGVLDLIAASREGLGAIVVRGLLGGLPGEEPERYALASPYERLPLGVPTLCVHGADDASVPAAMSERFATRAVERGDDCELVVLDGQEHVGHCVPLNPLWTTAAAWLQRRRDARAGA